MAGASSRELITMVSPKKDFLYGPLYKYPLGVYLMLGGPRQRTNIHWVRFPLKNRVPLKNTK